MVALSGVGMLSGCKNEGKSATLAGAGSSRSTTAKASAAPSAKALPAAKPPRYTAAIDGRPVAFSAAFVFDYGGEAKHLLLTDKTANCSALRSRLSQGPSAATAGAVTGARVFEATLARSFAAKAARSWKLGRVRLDEGPAAGAQRPIPIRYRAASPGSQAVVHVSEQVVLLASRQFNRPKDVRIALKKELRALNCGNLRKFDAAQAGDTAKVSLQVLGEIFPIQSATVTKNTPPLHRFGQYVLRLSSQGHSCDRTVGSDVVVDIYYDEGASRANLIEIGGELVFGQSRQAKDARNLRALKLAGTKQVRQGGELGLNGSVNLPGLQLVFSGSVKPKLCPKN